MPKIHKLSQLNIPNGLSKPARALKIAIASGGLVAKVLAQKAGMREQTLSEFLSGVRSGLRADYLEKLIDNLPAEQRVVFFQEWMGESIPQKKLTLSEVIDLLDMEDPEDRKQAANALRQIGEKFLPKKTDEHESLRENTEDVLACR